MEVILQKGCASLTGQLESYSGYYIRRSGKKFVCQRKAKGYVPADGQWRFIVLCAQMAGGIHIADIKVKPDDIGPALYKAHHFIAARNIKDKIYNARDIRNLITTFGL
jgi:hypothetical protein